LSTEKGIVDDIVILYQPHTFTVCHKA